MIIDAIVAFAIGPVISVVVSREKKVQEKYAVVASSLSFGLVLSLFLVGIGLVVYPRVLDYFVVVWMTLSIPIRLLIFITTMCLFACGQGHRVNIIYIVALIANACLNELFIYHLKFGFAGSYIATVIVSAIELIWFLWQIARLTGRWPFARFQWQWLQSLIRQAGAEWVRLVSWQLEGLVILALLASKVEWLPILSAFGVIGEFSALLLMPLIALMRTTAMYMAAAYPQGNLKEAWQALTPIGFIAYAMAVLLGIGLIVLSEFLGSYAYHLDGIRLFWWQAFAYVYGLALPLWVYSYLIRGYYQACGKFARIAIIEIFLTWLIFMPLLWFALNTWAPFLFFFAYVMKEAMIAIYLRWGLR